MTPLSPAAQAVRSAALYAGPKLEGRIAAALQAAVDQVVPMEKEPAEPPSYGIGHEPAEYVQDWTCWHIRRQFLDIAAQLGGGPTPPAES
jgi:hypothetical protein